MTYFRAPISCIVSRVCLCSASRSILRNVRTMCGDTTRQPEHLKCAHKLRIGTENERKRIETKRKDSYDCAHVRKHLQSANIIIIIIIITIMQSFVHKVLAVVKQQR